MSFDLKKVAKLLAETHRRCCICHCFCGVKIETDHITPKKDGGDNSIENAIPVCFNCHAEIHSYNDKHPRGRKFSSEELRFHKQQWIETCRDRPELFVAAARNTDMGPIQALVDEVEFNQAIYDSMINNQRGAVFADEQFRRAIAQGSFSTMLPELKSSLFAAYAAMNKSNHHLVAEANQSAASRVVPMVQDAVLKALNDTGPKIKSAYAMLLKFLAPEDESI